MEVNYQLENIVILTNDISKVVVKPISIEKCIEHAAGQYVVANFLDCELPLSIANLSSEDKKLEFHIRHDDKNPLAKKFMHYIRSSNKIALFGPKGNMTLEHISCEQNLLFLAGGTGIAPIKALLEQAITRHSGNLTLFWGIKQPVDNYLDKLLTSWGERCINFKYQLVLSEVSNNVNWDGPTGLLHQHLAKQDLEISRLQVYCSGPYPMVECCYNTLHKMGIAPNQFYSDMLKP